MNALQLPKDTGYYETSPYARRTLLPHSSWMDYDYPPGYWGRRCQEFSSSPFRSIVGPLFSPSYTLHIIIHTLIISDHDLDGTPVGTFDPDRPWTLRPHGGGDTLAKTSIWSTSIPVLSTRTQTCFSALILCWAWISLTMIRKCLLFIHSFAYFDPPLLFSFGFFQESFWSRGISRYGNGRIDCCPRQQF